MVKIIKRKPLSKGGSAIVRIIAIISAIIASGFFIMALGFNPIEVYQKMVLGAVATKMRLLDTISRTIPLLITSIGIMIAFKMKFWNIGGEGQILMGALGASFVALNIGSSAAKPLVIFLMVVAAMAMGCIWSIIPAFFKVKFGTNETIFTLMLNYIAIKIISFLQYGPWKDPKATGFPKIATFFDNAVLPKIFGVNIGIIFALLLLVLVYVFFKKTKLGYEVEVVGESTNTARYAGMNVNKIIVVSVAISGAICGLVGMIQASAIEKTLNITLSGGYGYTAIITAWLSGLNPSFILLSSFLFAVLIQGGNYIQIALQVPAVVANMITGIILLFVLGSEFFLKYKVVRGDKYDS